jgi:metal-responsive CopG/Arc/MetJ family transcriptional regulator
MANFKKPGEKVKPKISVTIDKELKTLLEEYLEDKNVNRSKYIEHLIKKDLEERGLTK